MTIGNKIRKIREIKNLKQESVAKSLNLSVNQYGKIERGESTLTFERLEEIAEVLGVSLEEIVGFDGETIYFGNTNSTFNHFNSGAVQNHSGLTDNERKLYEDKIKLLEEMLKIKDTEINRLLK